MAWERERRFLPSHRSASRKGDLGQRTLARCQAHPALSQSMARGHQERHWSCRRWHFGAPVTTNPPPWFAKTAHRGRFERLSVGSSVGHISRDYGRPVAAHRMQRPRRRFERYRHCRARERRPELRIGADRQQQDAVGHDFQQHLRSRYDQLDSRIGLRLPGHRFHSANDVGRGTNRFLQRPVPTYSYRRSDRNNFL
jgi:hypothetical protein